MCRFWFCFFENIYNLSSENKNKVVVVVNLKKKKIGCEKCGYKWESGSSLRLATCPSCGHKNKTRG